MFDTETLIEIISGRRHGFVAASVRFMLRSLTPFYRLAINWRNRRFDRESEKSISRRIHSVAVPVISIGNLTTGGTGKTPHVIWIARFLLELKFSVAIVSRGYRAIPDINSGADLPRLFNDEAIEMESRLPAVPHLQQPDRYAAARQAMVEFDAQVILLDDGFQHRRLHRDCDIVLIDATNPFGYEHLLPRGLLREPIASLQRADAIVLTRCELVTCEIRDRILSRLSAASRWAPIACTQMRPLGWLQSDGQQFPLNHLQGTPAFAFCALGNPAGFERTLDRLKMDVRGRKTFPDHHHFSRDELESLVRSAQNSNAQALICSHKDLVKIRSNQVGELPVFALLIDVEFVSGQQKIENLVQGILENRSALAKKE